MQSLREYLQADLRNGAYWALVALFAFVLIICLMDADFSPRQQVWLILLVVCLFISIQMGSWLAERAKHRKCVNLLLVLVPMVFSALLMFYFGQNNFVLWLLVLPIVALALELRLKPLAVALVCAALLILIALPEGLDDGWQDGVRFAFYVSPALIFVWAFSQTAMREKDARLEVELLATRLRAANDQLRQYAAEVEALAITRERNNMAREVHDSLGHYLTVVLVQIEAARAMLDRDRGKADAALDKAQSLTRDGLAEVRRAVSTLRESPLGDRPLVEALQILVDQTQASGTQVSLRIEGDPWDLDDQRALTLYRTAQEALTNVRKHARATRVEVCVQFEDTGVVLKVSDDGVGCAAADGGFGLQGLRERAALWQGHCQVESSPGAGFRVRVFLPKVGEAV